MALSGKYISIYSIIERVYMDNGYNDVPLQDSVVWAAQAMDKIGVRMAYEKAPDQILKVENGRGEFPCDLHRLVSMRLWPSLAPLLENRGKFSGKQAPSSDPDYKSKNYSTTLSGNTYERDGDYFYTPFDEGEVQISYYRFPVDENGFPKIPEDEKYAGAIAAYIQLKLDFRAFRKNEISGDMYMISKRDWAFKAGQAKQKALAYDNVDSLQSFRNQFVRLIPNMNFHDTAFANSTIKEQRRNNPTGVNKTGYLK